jgi:hypothetical protein
MFKLSAVHMYFSSTIRIQKCTGFKQPAFLRCLKDLQNVFFIDNPDPDPKLMLKPDPNPDKKKNSAPQHCQQYCGEGCRNTLLTMGIVYCRLGSSIFH